MVTTEEDFVVLGPPLSLVVGPLGVTAILGWFFLSKIAVVMVVFFFFFGLDGGLALIGGTSSLFGATLWALVGFGVASLTWGVTSLGFGTWANFCGEGTFFGTASLEISNVLEVMEFSEDTSDSVVTVLSVDNPFLGGESFSLSIMGLLIIGTGTWSTGGGWLSAFGGFSSVSARTGFFLSRFAVDGTTGGCSISTDDWDGPFNMEGGISSNSGGELSSSSCIVTTDENSKISVSSVACVRTLEWNQKLELIRVVHEKEGKEKTSLTW